MTTETVETEGSALIPLPFCRFCGQEIQHLVNWTRADLRSDYSGNGEYGATDEVEFLGTDNEFFCPECHNRLTDDEEVADRILGVAAA